MGLEVLPDDEDDEQYDSGPDDLRDGDPVRADLAPVVALAFDQAEDDPEQPAGGQCHSDEVPALAAAWTQVGNDGEGCDQGADANRHVDEEDPAPIDVGDDRPAQGRSCDGGEPGDAAPDAEGSSPPLGREDRGEDRERLRREESATNALNDAGGNELPGVLREAAQR